MLGFNSIKSYFGLLPILVQQSWQFSLVESTLVSIFNVLMDARVNFISHCIVLNEYHVRVLVGYLVRPGHSLQQSRRQDSMRKN